MRNTSSRMDKALRILLHWHTRISKTSLRLVWILKRHSSSSTLSIWEISTLTFVDSKDISTSTPWKPFSDSTSLIVVEKQPILLFKQLLAYPRVSLISLGKKIFLALFLAELIRIHISEWQEMSVLKLKLLNLLAFTQSSSPLFKDSTPKCPGQLLIQVFLWQTSRNKSKTKSRSSPSVGEKQPKKSKRNLGLT